MLIEERLRNLPWDQLESSLWQHGYAQTPAVLTEAECQQLVALYSKPELFRSRIDMSRYRFGRGDYQYFAYQLPELVANLRSSAYPHLAGIANRWLEALGKDQRYPNELGALIEECHLAGQNRPTPLLLHYEAGDYNCLHQDLYGEISFPLQMVYFLNEPGRDYTGGEFLLMEQQPRAQSIGHAIRPSQGEALIVTTRYRPVKGTRGYYQTTMRHGVSRVLSGTRFTLGIIFHDAK